MEFVMDFEYENRGSNGEKIISYQIGLSILTQEGKIYYEISAPTEVNEESEMAIYYIVDLIEKACIEEIT